MEQKKSLTMNGMTGMNFAFIIVSVAMIAVSIYLTSHYYDTIYPTRLGGGSSICDISNYFNCDAATYSKISNIAGVPISFFGIIVGLLFLFSSLMPSENLERTSAAVARYNLIGCVALFFFSLGVLGSLCPFCTLYYLLSFLAFLLIWKHGITSWVPEIKTAAVWFAVLLVGSIFFYRTTAEKSANQDKLSANVVGQYNALANLGEPDAESPYKIHMATKNWGDSPIRLTIFSDFQCPFCKMVGDQMHELIRRYPDKLSIQYVFYPLDASCNANVKTGMHRYACQAAYLAACDEKKFAELHDEIFAHQDKLEAGALQEIAKEHGMESCFSNEEVKNKVIGLINLGGKFNLKSTPTLILNGKKIEGTIPSAQYYAIFEDILRKK